MTVHSRVRCFQSLPAPSQAIEARCKPLPSLNGDMGHLTKGNSAAEVRSYMKARFGERGVRRETSLACTARCTKETKTTLRAL